MTRRSRHPAKTLLLLAAFGAAAWGVYRYWPALNQQIRGEEKRPDPELIERLHLVRSGYEGPTGIVGVLHATCSQAGRPSASR